MSQADFEPVIGLEVHCQLRTLSKIFCGCSTTFGDPPNENTCAVCLGHPGVLPVLNRTVVEFAIRLGLAMGCQVQRHSVFARKNYFYPDLPKGYQISQFDQPICEHGTLAFDVEQPDGSITEQRARIRRIHMEEDAGKNIHAPGEAFSLVDFNRAGVPLLEIVSEPDLRTSAQAAEYLKALRALVVALGISDGNMQEGSFRCDANVSIRPRGSDVLGTRVELKNINSFKFVMMGIDHEVMRQVALVESGGSVVQETRSFDPDSGQSRAMRSKEDAHDYRYFPDPDLPPLQLAESWIAHIGKNLPELPRARTARFISSLGLPAHDARVLNEDQEVADYFEAALRTYGHNPRAVANWLINEIMREVNGSEGGIMAHAVRAAALGRMVQLIDEGRLTGKMGKDLLGVMVQERRDDVDAIIKERGWEVVRDDAALGRAVDAVVAAHPSEFEKLKAGKQQILGFFVGKVLKELGGKADPKVVQELLKQKCQ